MFDPFFQPRFFFTVTQLGDLYYLSWCQRKAENFYSTCQIDKIAQIHPSDRLYATEKKVEHTKNDQEIGRGKQEKISLCHRAFPGNLSQPLIYINCTLQTVSNKGRQIDWCDQINKSVVQLRTCTVKNKLVKTAKKLVIVSDSFWIWDNQLFVLTNIFLHAVCIF